METFPIRLLQICAPAELYLAMKMSDRPALVTGPDTVHRVFEITRMSERLDFVDDPQEVQ